ncbi:MAG: DUF58 domain-containing protein [Gammaproteobacteria bacterium]
MSPQLRLIWILVVASASSLLAVTGLVAWTLWIAAAAVAAAAVIADGLRCWFTHSPSAQRELPASLAIGAVTRVRLRIHGHGHRRLGLRLFDHFPDDFVCEDFPADVQIEPGRFVDLRYRVLPQSRGQHSFGQVQCLVSSPFGLWWRRIRLAETQSVRVYPNFAEVKKYALLAAEPRLGNLGVVQRRRRGEGSEFHQLREYTEGDSLARIDWRASARMRKLISREYQDERDQTVVFLLDCGRRMRAKDGPYSHFDQALNALLLLTYVALRKGDSVGVATFSGDDRWLKPRKGRGMLNAVLNQLYDLQPSPSTPDYEQAALRLLARQRKRALVVIITNLRDEDSTELEAALHALRARHLVLIASLREAALDLSLEQSVHDLKSALKTASVRLYLAEREHALAKIRGTGVPALDVTPEHLSVDLVNNYLAIKAGGTL